MPRTRTSVTLLTLATAGLLIGATSAYAAPPTEPHGGTTQS